ncbi:MAG TPA: phage/plasmid primase, P4 family [Patescibacteria group bacterium]|uniref:Phage/plasmid primase, P4 family n=2 Tax=Katanobacteria TaxID=422282 RepID=A0A0G0VQR7_UNCKA|nr:MAG: Phage/plasmid primase, P4 family [candidate division TM6 bacterium GW2011_GWF2_33_332]KKS03229.1 MAG: Phage/plasmid primase, P4 family [candidate division WWE3 bacterium GW2011_GWC2_41_23]OGC58192.1 MAG: hypothetical protein A2245_00490 [candidate division WWE3 bacterium RIFOXYA2_FULL_43_12]HBY09785.1 hypothetical protein [candidate division WWE3 bacterium]HLD90716.1 phage/plasmid primase, P4 family [Patescibacteria group bacterium]
MSPVDYVKIYLELDWSLIPIIPKTKKPPIPWTEFQTRRATLAEVTNWINKGWYLAVVTGDISGVLVVDDDRVKHGLKEWDLTSPVIAISESKGKHYYFRYDRDIHSHSNATLRIDLKGWHSYALVPPFNGRQWISQDFDNLTPLSDEIVRLIHFDDCKFGKSGIRKPLNMADFVDIEEGARNDSLYKLACSVFNKLDKDTGTRVLVGVNLTYKPPLGESEFNHQVSQAWEFIQSSIEKQGSPKSADLSERRTDTSNAEKINELFGSNVRFDHRRKRWLIWKGHRWQPDIDGDISRKAMQAAKKRYHEVAEIDDYEKRKKAVAWAMQSENKTRLDAAIGIAKSLVPIADSGDNWDTNPMLLSCPNGIVDLTTATLREGRSEDRITMATAVNFDPNAACPLWEKFINEVFENNEELIRYVNKSLGYSISGNVREQVVFFCFGVGANGKSVLFSTIREILKDYAYSAPASMFQRNSMATATNDVASIEFRRFLMSSEILSSTKINELRLKKWSGGDQETARYLYSEFFSFYPVCKIWLFVNHKPQVEDDSFGFWRRMRLIPFNRVFKLSEQDKDLPQKLKGEFPGILNWLVKGCLLWQKEGLLPLPEIISEATGAYQQENDDLAEFVSDACVESDEIVTKASVLYTAYKKWAEEQKLTGKDLFSKTAFGRRMGDRFPKKREKTGICYRGIGIKNDLISQNNVGLYAGLTPKCMVGTQNTKTSYINPCKGSLLKNATNPTYHTPAEDDTVLDPSSVFDGNLPDLDSVEEQQ